jgi:hypothetical protein
MVQKVSEMTNVPQHSGGFAGDVRGMPDSNANAATIVRCWLLIRKASLLDAAGIVAVVEVIASERVHSAIDQVWTAARETRYLESLSLREAFHVAVDEKAGIVGFPEPGPGQGRGSIRVRNFDASAAHWASSKAHLFNNIEGSFSKALTCGRDFLPWRMSARSASSCQCGAVRGSGTVCGAQCCVLAGGSDTESFAFRFRRRIRPRSSSIAASASRNADG